VAGIRNPVSETSAVLACAGLHPMKALRLTICTVMVSPPKPLLSFILHSLCVEGLACAVSRSGSEVDHGLFFTKVEACLHHQLCLASQPTIQFPTVIRGNLKILSWAKQLLGPNTINKCFNSLDNHLTRERSPWRKVKKNFNGQILRNAPFH
jgi:hypothetical protein